MINRRGLTLVVIPLMGFLMVTIPGCDSHSKKDTCPALSFSDDFLIGVSSSAYQIEGAHMADGKGVSNWDYFSNKPENVEIDGNTAADHYNRYKEDIELLKQLGVKSYRFSIAWTRILPNGTGEVNKKGLQFYKNIISLLKQNNIVPLVTLYHWDLPQALEEKGGWANEETINAFEEYTKVVVTELGADVDWWTTFNEPWVSCFVGYWLGKHAPGQQNIETALQCTHNILLAHGKATSLIRELDPGAKVGITLDLQIAVPLDEKDEHQIKACNIINESHHAWFADPIYFGRYPQQIVDLYERRGVKLPVVSESDLKIINQPIDYLGLNYYHVDHFKMAETNEWWPYGVEQIERNDKLYKNNSRDTTGLYTLLHYLDKRYGKIDILITENGTTTNKDFVNYKGEVNDEIRIEHIYRHLEQCQKAINDGINVIGYTNWSFLDDYEWGKFGRMGMVYVDFQTQERIIKKSGLWYAKCIERNEYVLDY